MEWNYIKGLIEVAESAGWSQERTAEELGVTFAALNRWINGHARPRSTKIDQIKRLHRERVGLKKIPPSDYKKILRSASSYRFSSLHRLFASHADLLKEFVVDGTYQSNTIEGTKLSLRETQALIETHSQAKDKPLLDHLISLNHAAILKDVLCGFYRAPLTENQILEMHKRLFQGLRDDAGSYARHERVIMGLNIHLPHPEDVPEEMKSFLKTCRQKPRSRHAVEFMAEMHASFELIHPFGDGNGRIGRLILVLQCLEYGYPPLVIENIRKAEYYESLEEAQRRSADHLTSFFVQEIARSHAIVKRYQKVNSSIR